MKTVLQTFIILLFAKALLAQGAVVPQTKDSLLVQESATALPDNFIGKHLLLATKKNGWLPQAAWEIRHDSCIINDSSLYTNDSLFLFMVPIAKEITQKSYLLDSTKFDKRISFKQIPYGYQKRQNSAWDNLTYRGNFSRGLDAGNNQNVVLNSNFDLQLSGFIANDIEVLAALSDNSLPIQADGSSQQLQEFDRVFIQLSQGPNALLAGNYEVKAPSNYFMRYFKKTKGAQIKYQQNITKNALVQTQFSYGASQGKFYRQTLKPTEGNQGPYRLSPTGTDAYTVVLSGTEKVYRNGQLLRRGEDEDYIMDYNLAEITFTPKTYITANDRLIIEYEYADQIYRRNLTTAKTSVQKKKHRFEIAYYGEQDQRSPRQLDSSQYQALARAGDSLQYAFAPNINLVEEISDISQVTVYNLIDTLTYKDVLKLNLNGQGKLYRATFSFVGIGNGNYIKRDNTTNGEIFDWVAPDPITGRPRGDFAPITRVKAPQKQEMIVLSSAHDLGHGLKVKLDGSWTNKDLNRISSLNKEDNHGFGLRSAISHEVFFDSLKLKSLHTDLDIEWIQATFQPLNPYRSTEFNRDWNVGLSPPTTERIVNLRTKYQQKHNYITYQLQQFHQTGFANGLRNNLNYLLEKSGWKLQGVHSLLQRKDPTTKNHFFRTNAALTKSFAKKKWSLSFLEDFEYNYSNPLNNDSYLDQSYDYQEHKAKLTGNLSKVSKLELAISQRTDNHATSGDLERAQKAKQLDLLFKSKYKFIQGFDLNFTARHLELAPRLANPTKIQGWSFLGQANYRLSLWKKMIYNQAHVDLGSGQEPERSFRFIRVEPGQGQYKYVDFNQDSIQQLNEFVPADFHDEKLYLRVSTLSNRFVASNNFGYNYYLVVDPKKYLSKNKKWKKWARKLSFTSQLNHRGKTLLSSTREFQIFNPEDSSILSQQHTENHSLFINRNNVAFNQEWGIRRQSNKYFLQSGFEHLINDEKFVLTRFAVKNNLQAGLRVRHINSNITAENFIQKNYKIENWHFIGSLTYQPTTSIRLETEGKFELANNQAGIEKFNSQELTAKGSLNLKKTGLLTSSVAFTIVNFEGNEVNPAGLAMLRGLRNGQNYRWTTSYQHRFPNNIIMRLVYEGRKTGALRTIHQGRAQLNIIF